jgi:hypothetical protein
VRIWHLQLFATIGLVSVVYGVQRADAFDVVLGVAVLAGGSVAYVAFRRR